MLDALRERLRALTGRDGDGETGGEADGDAESGFVRSVLNASVLRGHGQSHDEARRELESVGGEAARLQGACEHER